MEHEGRKINPCHNEEKMGRKKCCHICYEKKMRRLKLITKNCQKLGKNCQKLGKIGKNCQKLENFEYFYVS